MVPETQAKWRARGFCCIRQLREMRSGWTSNSRDTEYGYGRWTSIGLGHTFTTNFSSLSTCQELAGSEHQSRQY